MAAKASLISIRHGDHARERSWNIRERKPAVGIIAVFYLDSAVPIPEFMLQLGRDSVEQPTAGRSSRYHQMDG
jgi:hypothetical protein